MFFGERASAAQIGITPFICSRYMWFCYSQKILEAYVLHLGLSEEMVQLLRVLLELVQVRPDYLLELSCIARSPLARGIGLDVPVQVLVQVP